MAAQRYQITVTIDGERYVLEIPLSADDHADFVKREPNTVAYVLDIIRQKMPSLRDRDFDENNVQLHRE